MEVHRTISGFLGAMKQEGVMEAYAVTPPKTINSPWERSFQSEEFVSTTLAMVDDYTFEMRLIAQREPSPSIFVAGWRRIPDLTPEPIPANAGIRLLIAGKQTSPNPEEEILVARFEPRLPRNENTFTVFWSRTSLPEKMLAGPAAVTAIMLSIFADSGNVEALSRWEELLRSYSHRLPGEAIQAIAFTLDTIGR